MPRRLLPIALACAALASAGCGEDSGDGTGAAPGGPAVEMTDYAFGPRSLTVARGAAIRVTNEGQIAHNLRIERGPDPTEETEELAGTDTFLPGDSETLTVDLAPARYVMVCTVPGHRELGMTGRIRVR
jgi:plastocyanin